MTIESWLSARTATTALGTQAERVVQVLARSPQFACYASAREVAERAGVNVSTVVRTSQQLGFAGWPQLRGGLRDEYLASLAAVRPATADATDVAALMLQQDATNLAATTTPENLAAIREIGAAIASAGTTVVLASGSGAGPATILGYLASVYGHDVEVATGSATAQAVAVSRLGSGDCLIVLNVWRLTKALRQLTALGHERGATVAVLTDLRSSPLGADADHVVVTPIEGVDETPSLTAMVAVVQGILAVLAVRTDRDAVGAVERAWERLGLMDDQG
ncbi:MurR/RpiR family transcriptional regulator [Mycetocola reblochoni]|uniref:Transcriptional regulator, RpiR family n=2 Tax=Mycetocola reblochoni TaxID=331618 RepID=A0A1R4IIY6_9MICO|nr:MurR/RpiR family transcriptional regulator [Mycetocola reblochoni]RLP69675.1 MurR/RpiR family transcriptional regulator [Mycetocola reblochoni]SJN19757.1 transcriptional regulator, RpiR family [Mycetocola reblochoni REB411]